MGHTHFRTHRSGLRSWVAGAPSTTSSWTRRNLGRYRWTVLTTFKSNRESVEWLQSIRFSNVGILTAYFPLLQNHTVACSRIFGQCILLYKTRSTEHLSLTPQDIKHLNLHCCRVVMDSIIWNCKPDKVVGVILNVRQEYLDEMR